MQTHDSPHPRLIIAEVLRANGDPRFAVMRPAGHPADGERLFETDTLEAARAWAARRLEIKEP